MLTFSLWIVQENNNKIKKCNVIFQFWLLLLDFHILLWLFQVVLPELASIRIAAYEDNGKFIGHRVLPVIGLCPGYRHVALRTEAGQPLPLATLFLHLVVKDYVPDGLSDFAEALANPIKHQSEREKRVQQLAVLTDDCDQVPDVEEAAAASAIAAAAAKAPPRRQQPSCPDSGVSSPPAGLPPAATSHRLSVAAPSPDLQETARAADPDPPSVETSHTSPALSKPNAPSTSTACKYGEKGGNRARVYPMLLQPWPGLLGYFLSP